MGMQLKKVFETVNRLLCDGNDVGLFVTAWMGVLELSGRTMTYVNADHNPPLLKRADGPFEYLRERTGFVLAGMEDTSYRQNTISIRPGDRLLLYTDGVIEAMPPPSGTVRRGPAADVYEQPRRQSGSDRTACTPEGYRCVCRLRAAI